MLFRPEVVRSLLICVFYAVNSTCISMVNKTILSTYNFQGTFILLAAQLLGALILMQAAKGLKSMGVGASLLPEIPEFNTAVFQKSIPVSLLFVGNVGCAFVGLRIVDVPLFLCVRRLSTLCVLGMEYLILGKVSSPQIHAAIFMIVGGALLAGFETFSSNWVGYFFIMMNNILTASLYTAKLTPFGLLYYNALVALPVSIALAFVYMEFDALSTYEYRLNVGWQVSVALSAILGVVMTYSTVLCNSVNSPLATSVTGNTKDLISTLIGWLLFGGFVATVYSVSGLAVSFIGSGWYSYIKLTEKRPFPQASAMVVQTDGEGTHRVDEELPASLKTSPVDAVGIRKRSPQ